MKNRCIIGFSLLALIGSFIVNGCKTTATDPLFVALAEIRFADYHQIEPIQIFVYPPNAVQSDSASWTPTPLTYGVVTPYFTNIATNRAAGETYRLAAYDVKNKLFVAYQNVTLKPGDKYTWVISGNSTTMGGSFDTTLINDATPTHQGLSLANYRFLNLTPNAPSPLELRVGDPISGQLIGSEPYRGLSPYVGIPFGQDTSITFYVVTPGGVVLGLLAGVGVDTGGYHTVTWGGQDQTFRKGENNGSPLLGDTVRIRIWDDDLGVTDVTPAQQFRYNLINALIPPPFPTATLIDYAAAGGLAIVIDNNTAYDYRGIMPFSLAPDPYKNRPDPQNGNVAQQVPAIISPYNPLTDKLYFNLVVPKVTATSPSPSDPIVFRFFAGLTVPGGGPLKSDQLYTIIVFDTVRKPTSLQSAAYDSSGGVATIPIPNAVRGVAKIVFGNMLAPIKGAQTSNNKGTFTITGGATFTKTNWTTKSFDSSIVATPGQAVNFEAKFTDGDYSFTLANPEAGAVYEVFLVGRRDHPLDKYKPQFIAVRINPIR